MSSANEREQESYAQLLAQLEASMGQARVQRCLELAQAGAHAAALQALSDIESLKVELEGARLDRKHKEEYEVRVAHSRLRVCSSTRPALARQVLRKQCLAFPSRADTQAAIAGVVQDIAALEQESAATAATVEVRAVCAACDCVALSVLRSPAHSAAATAVQRSHRERGQACART